MKRTFVVLLAIALAGCGGQAEQVVAPSTPAGGSISLLLVGVDGLDWTVTLRLLRDGRMPHLRSLIDRGVAGRLATIAPAKSPVIWTSVATGKPPEQHGIVDFFTEDAGERRLFTSADRRTKALWNILDDAGKRAIVVSWWNSFPAEPIAGVVVAQANTLEAISDRRMLKPGGLLEGIPGQVHPPARQEEMLEVAREVDREMPALLEGIFGDIGRATTLADRANLDTCAWSVRADESTRRVALRLAAEPDGAELLAVYFGTPDVVSHRFWRFHEPEAFAHPPDRAALAQFGEVVVDAYARVDVVLGELLAAVGKTANVVVVSDHGMHAYNTGSRFDRPVDGRLERESGGHEDGPPGMLVAAGPAFRRTPLPGSIDELREVDLPQLGHVLDLTPTLLTLFRLPVGRDMHGSVLDELLAEKPTIARIDSHDTEAWLASRPAAAAIVPGTAERLEQLRSLGYIGDDPSEEIGIFLVRHAEKDTDDPKDPRLSAAGRERADALAQQLSAVGVTHLYASQFKRTKLTLQPLAEEVGVEIAVIPAQEPGRLLALLRELPSGSVAVVAGHSNTIPDLVCELGGQPDDIDCSEEERALDEKVYDRLYFVRLPGPEEKERTPLETRSLRYGD